MLKQRFVMYNKVLLLLTGILLGVITTNCKFTYFPAAKAVTNTTVAGKPSLKYPIKATLYRFSLNKENMKTYEEWVQWHHDEYGPMIETLERERMYFESVFRDTIRQPDIIYWLTIDGEGGENSSTSNLAIDKKHNEYMKRILVKGSRSVLKTEFTLIPAFLEKSISLHQQQGK